MSSDVVLTAALRNNLLSLQNTQKSIDGTQLRLATGLKVNSALDNPQNFFASQALKNRASDLGRLLDGIGQNIQVIQAADNGVTALTRLVEQADSVAQNARDALAQGQSEAKVTGDKDLAGIDNLTTLAGIEAGDTISLWLTDEDGEQISIGDYGSALTGGTVDGGTITINNNDSIDNIIDRINNLQIDDGNDSATGGQAFEASLDEGGRLQVRSMNGGNFRVVFNEGFAADPGNDANALATAESLGFGSGLARSAGDQENAGDTSIEFTVLADVALRSVEMFRQDGAATPPALRSTLLSELQASDGTAIFDGFAGDENEQFIVSINGGEFARIDLFDDNDEAITIQGMIDAINTNGLLNTRIRAEFDDDTGQLSIRSLDASVQSIQIGVDADTDGMTASLGFGQSELVVGNGGAEFLENIVLGSASGLLAQFESEYNNIRDQISQLVTNGDTGYRGTNLLNGDNLLTSFNEFRTSTLTTRGVTFTADGLGMRDADFSRANTVDQTLTQVREALEAVRNFGSTLANDLAIIQTREDFTNNLINTLQEGSDKLVVADQNEEGAKLLAMQTRQQLGVTSLSLASQSQQSILRLF